jgi:hypothetical protein
MTFRTLRQLGAVLLVVGAIGAPAAQAGHQDLGARSALALDRPALQTQPTVVERILAQVLARGVDLCDGLTSCLAEYRTVAAAPGVAAGSSDGFDWGDAGIGAGTALGLAALGGAAALALRRRARLGVSL